MSKNALRYKRIYFYHIYSYADKKEFSQIGIFYSTNGYLIDKRCTSLEATTFES